MTLSLLEFAIVTTAIQYIVGASKLTETARIRLVMTRRIGDELVAPKPWRVSVKRFLECPKCLGYWLGSALSSIGPWSGLPWWQAALMSGFAGLVLTAVGRSLMDLAAVD